MDCPSILIYGYYNKNNFGDDWFARTFQKLFSGCNIKFTDNKLELLKSWDYIIIGGGNIIHAKLGEILLETKSPYEVWSVSLHDPSELQYISNARRIILRDKKSFSFAHGTNVHHLPDINFYPAGIVQFSDQVYSVGFIPNSNIIPNYTSTMPKNQEYFRFVFECARYLDECSKNFTFIPFQKTNIQNDARVAHAIVSHSVHKKGNILDNLIFENVPSFESYITMRYHGAFLGILSEKPVLCVDFHSKMTSLIEDVKLPSINYYEFSKRSLEIGLEKALSEDKEILRQRKIDILDKVMKYEEFAKQIILEIKEK